MCSSYLPLAAPSSCRLNLVHFSPCHNRRESLSSSRCPPPLPPHHNCRPLPRRLPHRQRLGQRHRLDPRYAVRRVPRGQGRPWQPPGRRHVHTVSVDPSQVRLSPSTPGGGGLSIHTKGLDPLLGWHQQAVWASTLCTHEMPGPAYSPSLNTRLGGAPSWGRLYAPCVERKWPKCPEGSKCSCSCLQSGFLSCPRGCTPT